MAYPQKIVTCCYCGTRAALVLSGDTQHELACGRCGAPLHDLKMLPKQRSGPRELVDPMPKPRKVRKPKSKDRKPAKPRKRRKSLMSRVLNEAVDLIEDIFD